MLRPSDEGRLGEAVSVLAVVENSMGHRTYAAQLGREFAEGRNATLELALTRSRDGPPTVARSLGLFRPPIEGVRRRELDLYRIRLQLAIAADGLAALRAHLRQGHTVVHFHTQVLAGLAIHGQIGTLPLVVSLDMTESQHRPFLYEATAALAWRTRAPSRWLERAVFERADALVPFTEEAAASLVRDYDVAPSRVHLIPPGVELGRIPPATSREEHRRGRKFRFLFVGNDFALKGGNEVLEAFRRLRHRHGGDLELAIATDGQVTLRDGECLHATIRPYEPAWVALFARSDALVVPSHREAMGHVYLEAGAFCLPVIAARLPTLLGVVDEGVNALLVEPGSVASLTDAMERLYRDPALCASLGAAGRARVEARYDAAKNATALDELYCELSQRRRPPATGLFAAEAASTAQRLDPTGRRPAREPARSGTGPLGHEPARAPNRSVARQDPVAPPDIQGPPEEPHREGQQNDDERHQ